MVGKSAVSTQDEDGMKKCGLSFTAMSFKLILKMI
jgi:hypothetical protein